MAFLRLQDLFGSLEVVVFTKDYEMNKRLLVQDAKLYIRGRVSIDGGGAKVVCERMVSFEEVPKELWLQFADIESFTVQKEELYELLLQYQEEYKTAMPVIVYSKKERAINRLPRAYYVRYEKEWLELRSSRYGEDNVRIKEKGIENMR